jgi:hypothetical protein
MMVAASVKQKGRWTGQDGSDAADASRQQQQLAAMQQTMMLQTNNGRAKRGARAGRNK